MSDEPGGDPVCWLAQLCTECGAVPGDGPACWRCGTTVPPASTAETPPSSGQEASPRP